MKHSYKLRFKRSSLTHQFFFLQPTSVPSSTFLPLLHSAISIGSVDLTRLTGVLTAARFRGARVTARNIHRDLFPLSVDRAGYKQPPSRAVQLSSSFRLCPGGAPCVGGTKPGPGELFQFIVSLLSFCFVVFVFAV